MIKTLFIGFGAFVGMLAVIYVLGRYGWPIIAWLASLG